MREVAPLREPSKGVIECLEQYLAEAKAGKVLGILVISSRTGGVSDCSIALSHGAGVMTMLGQVHFASDKLKRFAEEADGEGEFIDESDE